MKKTGILMLVSVLTIFALTACGCRNSKPAQTSPTTLPTVTTAPTTEMTTVPTTQMTEPTNATIQDGNGPLPGDMTDATEGTIVPENRSGMIGSGTGITGSITG